MNIQATILCKWIGNGTQGNSYRPNIIDAGFNLAKVRDITNQVSENIPPVNTSYVLEVITDDVSLALIEADPVYEVLTVEEI